MTLTNVDPMVASGTGGTDYNAVLDSGSNQGPMYIGPKPIIDEGITRLRGQFDGTSTYLPLSREDLYQNAVLLYAEADKVAGTSWDNTGSLGATGDLVYDNTPIQNDHFNMPGSGAAITVPDEAALDLTTEIEIVMRVASAKWHNRSGNQRLVAKRGAAGASSYEVLIGYDSQMGKIGFTPNGSIVAYSPVPVPFSNTETGWIKVTYSNSGGVTFYCAPDSTSEPGTWYQLGPTQSIGVTMTANTHLLYIGALHAIGADYLEGRFYKLIIRSTIGGSTVLNVDVPADTLAMTPGVTTTFTATSGQTVTLTSAASIILSRTPITVSVPYYGVAFDAAMFGDETQTTVMWAIIDSPNPPNGNHMLQLLGFFGGVSAHCSVFLDCSNDKVYISAYDGTSISARGSQISATGFSVSTTERYCVILYMEPSSTSNLNLRPALYRETTQDLVKNTTYDIFNGAFDTTSSPFDFFRVSAVDSGSTFEVVEAGVAVIPGFSGAIFSEPAIDDVIATWGQAAFDEDPDYDVGDAWIIDTAGSLSGGVGITVAEGDLIYVTGVGPITWDSIALSGRDPIFYGTGDKWESNITVPSTITISETDDVFMWIVISGEYSIDSDYIDIFEGFGLVDDAYIWFAFYPEAEEIDIEFDDDTGNFLYEDYPGVLSLQGLDKPILLAAWLDRSAATAYVYVVVDGDGSFIANNIDASDVGTMTLDAGESLTCDLLPGVACWGRGFTYGVDVIPPTYEIDDLYRLITEGAP